MMIFDLIYNRAFERAESISARRYHEALIHIVTISLMLSSLLLSGCESTETPSQSDERVQDARTSVSGSDGDTLDLGSSLIDMHTMSGQGDADTLGELRELPPGVGW